MQSKQFELSWASHPLREVLRLAWPTVISLLSMSLMTFVDTLFIGRLGAIELAAAGLGGVCVFTVLSFGMATMSAAKVKIGERQGQGDRSAVERALGAFLRLASWLGIVSIFVGWLAGASLPWLSADERTGQLAGDYVAIRALSFPIVLVGHAVGQWLQAQGDSQSAMRAAVMANIANAPLNALFIFGLGWGVAGAAVATASSALLETGFLLRLQYRRATQEAHNQRAHRRESVRYAPLRAFHWEKSTWADSWQALLVGLPTGVERVLDMMAFSAVPLLLARVSPLQVAAHQIVLQLMLFSFLPLLALSDSITVLVSQAVGARAERLVDRVHRIGLLLSVTYGVLCAVIFVTCSPGLAGVFTGQVELRSVAQKTLLVGAVLQLLNAPYVHFKGVLRGLSAFRYVAWVTVGCAWLITPPLTYLWAVHQGHGAPGAWLALCAEVACGTLLCRFRGRRPQQSLVPATG